MSTRTATTPATTTQRPTAMQDIFAEDLTSRADARALWRSAATPPGGSLPPPQPQPGWPSAMGFWLTESRCEETRGEQGSAPAPFRLRVRTPAVAALDEIDPSPAPRVSYGRPPRVVRIKGLNPGDGELVLSISGTEAQVVASPAAWEALSEPVLLAVCQYWRFATVDAQLESLTELAAGDLGHASMSRPRTLFHGRTLVNRMVAVRALLLDLAHFAGPLTDPYPYLSADRFVPVYQNLAEKLHLDEWSSAIDDRFEMVEDTYACATEKLFEYKNFAWEAFLEIVIIVLLATELFVQFMSYFGE